MVSKTDNLSFYTYKGRIETENSTAMIIDIGELASTFDYESLQALVISLKHSGSFAEPDAMDELLGGLDKIKAKLSIDIVLIDYCHTLFERLKPHAATYHIKLLHDTQTAEIFFNPDTAWDKLSLLIYETDRKCAKELQNYLEERKSTIDIAPDTLTYQKMCKSKTFDHIITDTALNLGAKKRVAQLSKSLISHLPFFIDNVADTLSSVTDLEATKMDHGIKKMRRDIDKNALLAMMTFNGDIEGSYLLIFPHALALKAMAAFTGETIEETDLDNLKDSVGEFCNIITGNIKTALQNEDTNLKFALPQTFDTLEDGIKLMEDKEGVWIDMLLDKDPFYIFITQ